MNNLIDTFEMAANEFSDHEAACIEYARSYWQGISSKPSFQSAPASIISPVDLFQSEEELKDRFASIELSLQPIGIF